MIHIYYIGLGEDSAQTLQKHLKALGAESELHWTKDGDFKKEKGDLVVNWGSPKAHKFGNAAKWLNKKVSADKLKHLQLMQSAGVPVVEFTTGAKPSGGKWLGRQLKHWDGSDLEKHLDKNADFWVKWIDIKEEYRVHVFKGQVLRASLKVPVEKWEWKGKLYQGKANQEFRIGDFWGTSNHDYAGELPKKLLEACVGAVDALKYDFGGVDVARWGHGDLAVLEVNSAPWLGGDAATKYAKLILKEAK